MADMTDVPLPPRLLAHYRLVLGRDAVCRVLREDGHDPAGRASRRDAMHRFPHPLEGGRP